MKMLLEPFESNEFSFYALMQPKKRWIWLVSASQCQPHLECEKRSKTKEKPKRIQRMVKNAHCREMSLTSMENTKTVFGRHKRTNAKNHCRFSIVSTCKLTSQMKYTHESKKHCLNY